MTDVTGVGIRNLLAGNLRKSAGIMRFGNGLPRQCAHWLAMTGFFDSLRNTTQRVVFLFVITLRFCCSHPRISQGRGSVRGKPLRVSPLAFNHPSAGDRFCAAKSPLQKNTTTQRVVVFFWSGRRGSNSLPRPWQGRALPDELRPQTQDRLYLSSQRLSTPVFPISAKNLCPPLRAGMPAFIA